MPTHVPRSSLPLLAALLCLAAVGADFVRRVVGGGGRVSSGGYLSASALRALAGDGDVTFEVDSFDGGVTTLSAVVVSTGKTPIAEVSATRFELGGKQPLEATPCQGHRESADTFRIRCRFRDVDWQRLDDAQEFTAGVLLTTRMWFEGCATEDARDSTRGWPLRIRSGPGFADLQRHLGGR